MGRGDSRIGRRRSGSRSRRRSWSQHRSPARRSPLRRSPARHSPGRRSPARRSPARRSPLRSSSPRRSRSVDVSRQDDRGDDSEVTSQIVDGIRRSSGEQTWRAEVSVPRETGGGSLGKRGTTSIRGPNRISKEMAQDDIDLLKKAFKEGGSKEVRKCQQELNRSWVNAPKNRHSPT
uniref:Uncharacterized protein n=1 Tax=Noctiluca scintillans TaxID=2966 RepID=A0A7S1FD96_NOCSC